MTGIHDDKLIENALNGNHNAYRELVVRYQQLIFAAIFKIVGNYQDAEDLAQEVFIKAYRSMGGFRGDCKFSTWLIRIATNKALDHIRKQQKQGLNIVFENNIDANNSNSERTMNEHESQPETAYINKERSVELQQHINAIPEIYRQVLVQSYIDELSCREIAENEGVPVKTIASRLYRGKKILRSQNTPNSKGGKQS